MAAFLFGERDVPRVLGAGLSPAHREEFSTLGSTRRAGRCACGCAGGRPAVVLELLEIKRSPTKPPRC